MIGHDFPYLDTRDLNLDWLLKNMKQLLADWATYQQTMNQNFSDLESAVAQFESDITTAFNNLHDYVEDYFENLDVQQEINNKLNAMKLSGELAEIMNPLIASETATWLSTHITNPSNPPIDTSLSVSGAAADAKVTGDRLSDLKSAIKQTYDVARGGVNLLKIAADTRTINGITFVASSNGTVVANGTATANSIYGIAFTPIKSATYRLSGCPAGGSLPRYYQRINNVVGDDTGNGVNISLVAETAYYVWIVIANGATVSNLQFTPTLICNDISINYVKDKANEITHEIVYENKGEKETFLLYSNFDHYGLNTDGTFIDTEPNRVSCTERITFDNDTVVYVDDGFKWGYIPYIEGAYSTWSGWKTTPFTIPAGTEFVVQIARQTEITSEVANVVEFTSAVTFYKKTALNDRECSVIIDSILSTLSIDGTNVYETVLTNGTPANPRNDECVATDYVPVAFGQTIQFVTDREAETGYTYIYGIYGYDSSKTKILELSPTAREGETSEYTITNNSIKYIRYAIAQIGLDESIKPIRVASFYNYFVRIIVTNNVGLPYDISYYGKPINTKKGKAYISQSWITQPSPVSIDAAATQGFAIYGGVVFQLYSGSSHIALIDYESGNVITTMAANVAHGNSMQFLNEFYVEDDEFPMAIIADGLTNEAYKVRVTRNSITVIETYAFDISKCGYYVSTAVDALNDIVYTIGYTNDSYNLDDSGTNRMIIAAWDINRSTAVGDDLSPLFLESFTVPFMHTIQGPTFFNGLFFVFSSPGTSENPTKLYAIDPGEKKIVNRFDNFKGVLETKECESLYFYEHNDGGIRCYVKGNSNSLAYYILDFNS